MLRHHVVLRKEAFIDVLGLGFFFYLLELVLNTFVSCSS